MLRRRGEVVISEPFCDLARADAPVRDQLDPLPCVVWLPATIMSGSFAVAEDTAMFVRVFRASPMFGEVGRVRIMLLVGSLLLLVIACTDGTSLVLARTDGRGH